MVKRPPLTLPGHLDRSQSRCQVGLGRTLSGGPEPTLRALLCFCGGGQWADGHVGASQSGLGLPPLPSLPGMASISTPLPTMFPLLGIIQPLGCSLVWHLSQERVLQTAAWGGHSPLSRGHSMSRPLRPSVLLSRVHVCLLPRSVSSSSHVFISSWMPRYGAPSPSLWSPVSLTWHLCLWGRDGEDCWSP